MKQRNGISRRHMFKVGATAGAAALFGGALGGRLVPGAFAEEEVLPQVPRRVLGKTGQSVPILLLGGGVKLDPRFDPKLAEGMRFGVNYVDAADCYGGGSCEPAVGAFHTRAGVRNKLWITSKSDKHDPKGFEAVLNESLEKLKTDYVDMYFLHAVEDPDVFNKDLLAVVERVKKEGKIKFFGFSCHDGNVADLLQLAAKTAWVDTVMFRYNFRQYGNTELNQAMDACVKSNVGLIAMKTQGSEASFQEAWQKFEQTGKWNKFQSVLKAVWADERIAAAVSHMDTLEKLKENIAAALDQEDLGQAEWKALEDYARATRGYACDGCDHLCGAAAGTSARIGSLMRGVMYHDAYGDPSKARELFGKLPAAARNLDGADLAAAGRACPNGIDVAAHMERAREILRG